MNKLHQDVKKNVVAKVVDVPENSIKWRCWVVNSGDGWAAEAAECGWRVFNFTRSLYFSVKEAYAQESHFKCNNKVCFLLADIHSTALIKSLEIVRWIHYCARAHAALFFMSPQERRCIPNFVARISLLMSAWAPVVFICSSVVAEGLRRSSKAFPTCSALCRRLTTRAGSARSNFWVNFPSVLMRKMSRAQIRCKSALSAVWRVACGCAAIAVKILWENQRQPGIVQHKYATSDHHGNVPGSSSQRRTRFGCVVLPRGRY